MFRGRDAQIDALMRQEVCGIKRIDSIFLENLTLIASVTIAHIIPISPGPDFIVACRNAIQYSRKLVYGLPLGLELVFVSM